MRKKKKGGGAELEMDEPEFSIIDRKQMNMGELASARLTKTMEGDIKAHLQR